MPKFWFAFDKVIDEKQDFREVVIEALTKELNGISITDSQVKKIKSELSLSLDLE